MRRVRSYTCRKKFPFSLSLSTYVFGLPIYFLVYLFLFTVHFIYSFYSIFINFILSLALSLSPTHPPDDDGRRTNGNDEREEGLEYCGLIRSTGNSGHYPAVVLQGHHSATTSIFQHALKYKRFDWFYSCDSVERRR